MSNIVCYDSNGQILNYYTQWDVNQKLIIKGADMSSAPDFHFLNNLIQDTYVIQAEISNGGLVAKVPDEILQYSASVIVHICYEDGTTEYTVRIPVMPRKKPDNYVYTDTGSGSGGGGSSGSSVSIIDNLITNDSKAALSAAQGVVIKSLIDDLDVEIEGKIGLSELDTAIESAVRNMVDSDDMNNAINAAVNSAVSDKVSSEEMNAAINNATKDMVSVDEMNTAIGNALSNFEGDGSGEGVLIANNLATNNPNMALGATQGVILNDRLAEVESNIDNMVDTIEMNAAINDAVKDKVDVSEMNAAIEEALGNFEGGSGEGSGKPGEDGATFIPSVDYLGNLSWTNDKGLDNPDSVNIKGDPGKTPERGVDYWTNDDIAEIKSYVDNAILGGEW